MPYRKGYDRDYPTDYSQGYQDGYTDAMEKLQGRPRGRAKPKTKRKLSAWNKFVKANSNKKKFQYANGKLKLKKMGIAYRKKKR